MVSANSIRGRGGQVDNSVVEGYRDFVKFRRARSGPVGIVRREAEGNRAGLGGSGGVCRRTIWVLGQRSGSACGLDRPGAGGVARAVGKGHRGG